MEKQVIITGDGSHSLAIPGLQVTYHSIHGAIRESKHVFIDAGLSELLNNFSLPVYQVFEMGLGTGLNALLTAIEAEKQKKKIYYCVVEAFPLSVREAAALNYSELLFHEASFLKIHESNWEEDVSISEFFTLRKEKTDLVTYSSAKKFYLVYYDAFAPNAQPELWTKEMFQKLFTMLEPAGTLVTYCSKGDVRRAMMAAGFTVKKMPGPPGKREMLKAAKPAL